LCIRSGNTLRKLTSCGKDDPNFNFQTQECFLAYKTVVTSFSVEVDGQYGPYFRCNPEQRSVDDPAHIDTHVGKWGCFEVHGRGSQPWIPPPTPPPGERSKGTSCPSGIFCPKMNTSVGRDPALHMISNKSVATYFGGWWYSTLAQGECTGGRTPGDGLTPHCSWRQLSAGKIVNATCLRKHLQAKVEAHDPKCFSGCSQPLDDADPCYDRCLTQSILGNASSGVLPIDIPMMVGTWERAFAIDTVADGGCPAVLVDARA
jgi:hypothetical protein